MSQGFSTPVSPCVHICQLDDKGLCVGCLRTLDEITCWPELDRADQARLLEELERRRLRPAS